MVAAGPDAKDVVRVSICTNVGGLREAVERAFAASPLAAGHTLHLEDLPDGQDAPRDAEILLADPGKVAPVLDSVRGLRWLQSTWAGVNALGGVARRDYTCTRLAGCFGPQMSEYVFGALLSEDWAELGKYQANVEWTPEPFRKRRRLSNQTMGFLGVGDISSIIALRAQAFGMKTIGFATKARECAGFDSVGTDLAEVLRSADIIVNVLPSTPQTRGLLNRGAFKACGSEKVFINVGRGDVVSEECLLEALHNGWLRQAVLDVFVAEPLPATSRLWKHPAVRVSPHIAAVTYPDDSAQLFVENLGLWLEGKALRFKVDLDKGY